MAGRRLRTVALLALAALGLHELRYLAGYGAGAESALAEHGHGYLGVVAPLVGLLAGVAVLELLLELSRARRKRRGAKAGTPFTVRWAFAAFALVLIYTTQELVEGALLAGHPAGIAGVLGHGGWTALVVAIGLGAGVAALLCGAEVLVRSLARRAPRRHRRTSAPRHTTPVCLPRLAPLAVHLAGRAPPQAPAS